LALQLADALRAEIQEGLRRPGSQLPTESEFQHDYGVSRTTIRAALATLAAEGLVVTRKGFGSYVRDRPPLRRISSTHRHASHRVSGKPEFDTEAIAQGQVPSRRMLMTGRGPVPADVADWLGSPAGEQAVLEALVWSRRMLCRRDRTT
jgi:GntR family transcriptional regulator